MASSTLPIVLTAIVAGAAAGMGTNVLMAPTEPDTADTSAVTPQKFDALKRELAVLEDEQMVIQQRLQSLQLEVLSASSRDPVDSRPQPILAGLDDMVQLQRDVADLNLKLASVEGEGGPLLIEQVNSALESIRDEEDQKRREDREDREEQRREELLERLTEELGLDNYQQGQMGNLMTNMDTKRDEILQGARESGGWDGMRESFTAMRDEAMTSMGNFLTPSQLTSLEEMGGTRSLFGRSGFDRGRGGPGGFGGGGGGRGADSNN